MLDKLRGFFDPDDMEFKNTMKNARMLLEVPLESAMPYKSHNDTQYTKPVAL